MSISWFKSSAAILMRYALLWDITRRRVVTVYRRFGTTCRSLLHGSRVRDVVHFVVILWFLWRLMRKISCFIRLSPIRSKHMVQRKYLDWIVTRIQRTTKQTDQLTTTRTNADGVSQSRNPFFFWKPNIYYLLHKSPISTLVLSNKKTTSNFFTVEFDIILPSTTRFQRGLFSSSYGLILRMGFF
jgi:hypothetical protein